MENSWHHTIDWLNKLKPTDRFFLFVHGYDCHGQFPLPKDYKGSFFDPHLQVGFQGTPSEQGHIRELGLAGKPRNFTPEEKAFWTNWYDSKIRDADSRLEEIVNELDHRGLLKKTILVVFSDHGTEFVEHGRFDHGHTLYDELIHVPFVIVAPSVGKASGTVVRAQVSTLDILPTVLDLLGVKSDPELQRQMKGRSLATAVRGKPIASRDVFSETDYRNYTHKRSIRTADGWKYIMTLEDGSDELYNLKRDPHESTNLTEKNVIEAKLRKQLTNHLLSIGSGQSKDGKECLPVYPEQCKK